MSILSSIWGTIVVPRQNSNETKSLVKKLVSHYSSGNVSLQNGNYLTASDLKKIKKEVLGK